MTGRELGCKVTLLLFGMLTIFGFFAGLMSYSESGLRAALLRKQQRDTQVDLQLLGTGLQQYAAAHGGKLPDMSSSEAVEKVVFPDYVPYSDAFTRMVDNQRHLPNPTLSGKVLQKLPSTTLLFAEADPKPLDKAGKVLSKTRGVVRADGTVARLTAEEWSKHGW